MADVSNLNPDEGVTTVVEIVASPKNDETQNQSQQQKQQQQNETVSSSQQRQPQQQQNQDKPQKEHKQQQHETIHSSQQQQQQQNQHKPQEPQPPQQHQQQHQHHHRHHHHLTEPKHTETYNKNFDEESNNKVLMNCDSEIVSKDSKHKDCQENDNSKTSNGETGCVSTNAKSFHKNETGNMSSKSFQEVSTNCPSETTAVKMSSAETSAAQMSSVEVSAVQMSSAEASSSYETTYPVFTGQSEYGQESVHVEPFYRYRVYSESKV